MHSIDGYIVRSPYSTDQQQQLNHTQAYYRLQPHSGAIPLLQHSHGLLSNASPATPASDSLTLTEMSLVNSHLEPNSYYSSTNPNYPPDPSTILHQAQHVPSDLMTNAFTYNVTTSSAPTGLYPISSDLVAFTAANTNPRTYTEIGSTTDMSHHVAALGPMVGCIDSLSSSTSDKTAELDEEWHLPKHHGHSLLLGRNGALVPPSQPYLTYVRSNEVSCLRACGNDH